jgi:hypothetical protein
MTLGACLGLHVHVDQHANEHTTIAKEQPLDGCAIMQAGSTPSGPTRS